MEDWSGSSRASAEIPCAPRDVLAAVMALRPRRFHLVRANASVVILRLSSTTAAGFEQALEVRMLQVASGTEVSITHAGTVRAGVGAEVCQSLLSDLGRTVDGRARATLISA